MNQIVPVQLPRRLLPWPRNETSDVWIFRKSNCHRQNGGCRLAFTFLYSLKDTSEGCLNDNTEKETFDQSGGDSGAGEYVVAEKKAANQIGALAK